MGHFDIWANSVSETIYLNIEQWPSNDERSRTHLFFDRPKLGHRTKTATSAAAAAAAALHKIPGSRRPDGIDNVIIHMEISTFH